jgi:hypothetical protein
VVIIRAKLWLDANFLKVRQILEGYEDEEKALTVSWLVRARYCSVILTLPCQFGASYLKH